MAHRTLTLTHAKEVVTFNHTSTPDQERTCEHGHIGCARECCPCCYDEALTVIETEGTDADLEAYDLKRREG